MNLEDARTNLVNAAIAEAEAARTLAHTLGDGYVAFADAHADAETAYVLAKEKYVAVAMDTDALKHARAEQTKIRAIKVKASAKALRTAIDRSNKADHHYKVSSAAARVTQLAILRDNNKTFAAYEVAADAADAASYWFRITANCLAAVRALGE